ncbi:hypothetical protein ACHAWT_008162, partial [Skeletonema menzelii]
MTREEEMICFYLMLMHKDILCHESLPPQRIQRSSHLVHIESPGDTSDVDVPQEIERRSRGKPAV